MKAFLVCTLHGDFIVLEQVYSEGVDDAIARHANQFPYPKPHIEATRIFFPEVEILSEKQENSLKRLRPLSQDRREAADLYFSRPEFAHLKVKSNDLCFPSG